VVHRIAVIAGDGIGPEVTAEALKVLRCTGVALDTTDYDQHARAIRPNTKLLYLESPTNPTLRVVDLKKTSALARQHGLLSMIDSTFGTPINQRPAEFGIDLIKAAVFEP